MKRLVPVVLLVLTYAAYVRAADPAYQKKIDALLKKAQADRKAKGLDKNLPKAVAAYPTPEVTFKAVEACPGATVPVSVTGKFPEGTGFVVQSDDVDVKEEKGAANSWAAKLTVKPTATPHSVMVVAVAPVSGAQQTFKALDVACKQVWSLVLDNGETLTVRTEWKTAKSSVKGEGEWTKPGAAADKADYEVAGSAGSFSFERVVTPAEQQQRMTAMQRTLASPQARDISKRRDAATNGIDACAHKLGGDMNKMMQCMAPLQVELNTIAKEHEAMMKRAVQPPKVGCEQVTVDVTDGKLNGMGDRCSDGKTHKATGTVKVDG